jgi:DNA-binding MarR family transcriptional regulator
MTEPIAFRIMNEIGIIQQLASTLLERELPHGLTLSQFVVLNHFVRLGGSRSPNELARAMQVTKATMTSTLQRLEAKGFISVVPDPKDGRAKRVSITEAGRKARTRSVDAITPHLAELTRAIGAAKLESLLPALSEVRTYLDRQRSEDA